MQNHSIHRKSNWRGAPRAAILAVALSMGCLLSSGVACSAENEALTNVKQAKAVIDFRTGDPKKALILLNLIGDTFRDRNIRAVTAHRDFEVVFGGESVKLFAKDTKAYSPDEQKVITEVRQKISALARDGIKFEYCTYGGRLMGVEPTQVAGVSVVDNGWVSLIGYQARGYSLVAAY